MANILYNAIRWPFLMNKDSDRVIPIISFILTKTYLKNECFVFRQFCIRLGIPQMCITDSRYDLKLFQELPSCLLSEDSILWIQIFEMLLIIFITDMYTPTYTLHCLATFINIHCFTSSMVDAITKTGKVSS